jgi:hypothetical protein
VITLESVRNIIAELNRHNVRYVIIGGVAMRLHGSAHLTDDLDICYGREADNLSALVATLAEQHPRLRGAPPELPFIWDIKTIRNGQNFTLSTDLGEFDALGDTGGIDSFEGLWDRRVEMEILGERVNVASIDDLIAMKRAANRPKDQNHVLELLALKRLTQEE